jgi:hypothetical protein
VYTILIIPHVCYIPYQLSISALPLWYPINEKLPQLRSKFFGAGSSKVRKGALENKACEMGLSSQGP